MRKQLLPERHERLLYRLCDLAYRARVYAESPNEQDRMRQLRMLAEEALKYSAAVRTISAKAR